MGDTPTPQEQAKTFRLHDLQEGDELLLRGGDMEAGAVVLRVYPYEVVVHWLDIIDRDTCQMHVLGSHADIDPTKPFAPRFTPGQLTVGTFVMLVPGTSDDARLQEFTYLRVMRGGNVIFEVETPS